MFDSIAKALLSVLGSLLTFALTVYNSLTGVAVGLLGQDPATFNSSGWNFVEGVNTVFLGIGAALVVVFFLIGFCSDSLDIKQDFRLENILRMFLKICLAEFFVVNSIVIVRKLFALATGIIKKLSGNDISFQYSIPQEIANITNDPLNNGISGLGGACFGLLLLIMGLVFLLMIAGCGMMIVYEAYQRFFKIMMLVPYGALANSTIAGNHTLNHTAEAFWKYALGTILEAVTMYMGLALSAAMMKGGVVNLTDGETGALYILGWILESSFVCMLTLGVVKGTSTVTQKALGL